MERRSPRQHKPLTGPASLTPPQHDQGVEGEPALAIIDRISRDYTGEDFPMRSGVVYVVEPERAFTMSLPFRER